MLLLLAGSLLSLSLLFLLLSRLPTRRHLGVYTLAGPLYPLKFLAFSTLLLLRRLRPPSAADAGGSGGYGRKSRGSERAMELVQPLSSHPRAIDAAYFNGYSDGWYFGAGIQRRHGRLAECVMLLRAPAGVLGPQPDILEWPWGPATDAEMPDDESWSASGLSYQLEEPMRAWRVRFDGTLRERRGRRLRRVKYDLAWRATTPVFDFDTDMDAVPTTRAVAREPWTSDFFDRLRDAHQTHYEQFGRLEGVVDIEGVGQRRLALDSMRDRSFGRFRDWSHFHRYVLQYFVLEDSTCVAFHLVSLPVLMSHLVTGFVVTPAKEKLAITDSSLSLWQLGEAEPPPDDYAVDVTVKNGDKYQLRVHLVEKPVYFCGWDWEAKLYSALVTVRCRLPDGRWVAGSGMCEFEYRHTAGRSDGRRPDKARAE